MVSQQKICENEEKYVKMEACLKGLHIIEFLNLYFIMDTVGLTKVTA